MTLRMQRRIAARVLGVGENKVWMNPIRIAEINEAITRQDIADLIKDGVIKAREKTGIKTKIKRKRKGTGSKKGNTATSKRDYIMKIRKLRRYIQLLKENSILEIREAKKLRSLSKAGHFKSQRHLKDYILNILKKDISKVEVKKEKIKK